MRKNIFARVDLLPASTKSDMKFLPCMEEGKGASPELPWELKETPCNFRSVKKSRN